MAKTCPSVARGQLQAVFAVIEDVSGVLQLPTADGYIVPAGRATMTQTPTYTDSEELSPSLNPIAQFQNAVPAGTGSIPLYGRVNRDFSKPEGDALFVALQGDYNDPALITAELAEAVATGDNEIVVSNIQNLNDFDDNALEGQFPPRGVIRIGDEKILYRDIEVGANSATLKKCKRGYDNTLEAEHEADALVQMLSRIYSQAVCRPTLSIWILNDDKFLTFMSGCSVTQCQVRLQRESGQMFTFDYQGRQMGWAGTGEVESVTGPL